MLEFSPEGKMITVQFINPRDILYLYLYLFSSSIKHHIINQIGINFLRAFYGPKKIPGRLSARNMVFESREILFVFCIFALLAILDTSARVDSTNFL